jgi:hypothetical protein
MRHPLAARKALDSGFLQQQTWIRGEAIRLVARLGGFLGRKGDGHPGAMVLWRGMQALVFIGASWVAFGPRTTKIYVVLCRSCHDLTHSGRIDLTDMLRAHSLVRVSGKVHMLSPTASPKVPGEMNQESRSAIPSQCDAGMQSVSA